MTQVYASVKAHQTVYMISTNFAIDKMNLNLKNSVENVID